MKKKAFTLVELLAVITILGVIALIVIPSVDAVVKNSKSKVYEKQKEAILLSLQEWLTDNKDVLYISDSVTLTLGDLKEQNYVDYDIRNPRTDKCISNDLQLTVRKANKKYEYSIVNNELVDGSDNDCDVSKRYPSIYLVGANSVNLEINTTYAELGYSAKDINDNNITSSVVVTNSINNNKLGSYNVVYEVTTNGLTKTKVRTVNVVDTTKPVINIPENTILNTTIDTFDFLAGVTITDNSGEVITPKINSNLSIGVSGIYEILYIATDSSGNTSYKKRIITVDTVNPTIGLTVNREIVSISLSDNTGVIGYSITTSNTTPTSWTVISSTRTYTTEYTATSARTYYVHVKDAAGRTNYTSFEISPSAFRQYELINQTYTPGSTITWANKSWKVIKDNGVSVDLILAENYGTGIYGSSTDFSTSTAKTVVNTNFVNSNNIIKIAIEEGTITYNSSTSSYIRLPYETELSTNTANSNDTPFWTMSSTGNNLYLGFPSGVKNGNYVSKTTGAYYSGFSTSLAAITKTGIKTVEQQSLSQAPNVDTVTMINSATKIKHATTYASQYNVAAANAAGYGCDNSNCPNAYCGARTMSYYGDSCTVAGAFTYYVVQDWWNANYNVYVTGNVCGSNTIVYANGNCQDFYQLTSNTSSIGYRPVINILKRS